MTHTELTDRVKLKEVTGAIMLDGTKKRLFVSTDGYLCNFKKGSSRRGYPFYDVDNIKSLVLSKETNELERGVKLLDKYRKLAEKASFTNEFVRDCLTTRTMEEVRTKTEERGDYGTLYLFGITTGNKIDGKCISIDGISKQYPSIANRLREAIKNQTSEEICNRLDFRGYEMTISTVKKENGDFIAFLSMEYKDCLNGYYYLLINDETFIGHDVD